MAESRGRRALIGPIAAAVSALALVLLIAAGPGTRMGLWAYGTGFSMLRGAAYLGVVGAVLGLAGLVLGPWRAVAAGAIVLGLAAFVPPWLIQRGATGKPPIHDITTDPEDPPQFVTIVPLRRDAKNPIEYGGPEVAAQQRKAYPDIRSVFLPDAPIMAYEKVERAARGQGWEFAFGDRDVGRIEATDTTPWFGFKDDIVIRIRPQGKGSRVDVRSVSRVGRGDVGKNAQRIRDFVEALRNVKD